MPPMIAPVNPARHRFDADAERRSPDVKRGLAAKGWRGRYWALAARARSGEGGGRGTCARRVAAAGGTACPAPA